MSQKPVFISGVTHVPAEWANLLSSLAYDVFDQEVTKNGVRAALGIGTLGVQAADNVQIAGGSINGVVIGASSKRGAHFTYATVDTVHTGPTGIANRQYVDAKHVAALAAVGVLTTRLDGLGQTPVLGSGSPFADDILVNGITVGIGGGTGISINNSVAIGVAALASNVSGNDNVAVGSNALNSNTSGTSNIAIGLAALASNVSGNDNVAVGPNALNSNTSGTSNIAIGKLALLSNNGEGNTAVGPYTLANNTTGSNNVAVGAAALVLNTTGSVNVVIGNEASYNNTVGSNNTTLGYRALFSNWNGNYNIAIGYKTLESAGGSNNIAIGANALLSINTSYNNTAIGADAGNTLYSGSNNTFIGNGAVSAIGNISNQITLGNSSITTLRCQVTAITALSDRRDKTNIVSLAAGLDFVTHLKPVSFDWNTRDGAKVGISDTGFIAQDLKQIQIDTGILIPDLVYEANPERLEAAYGKLLPVLVKAIQELKAEFDQYKSQHP